MADTVNFLNTRFDRMRPEEAVELLLARSLKRQSGRIYYGNANTMVIAAKNPALLAALNQSDLLLADGSGVRWGSALLGTPLIHNLNGTDLVPALCKAGASKGLSVYLLGAKPGVAEEAAVNLAKAYPGLIIAGVQHGYFSEKETQQVLEGIRATHPHLLLVGMGVPLQEIWLNQYASQVPGTVCMGVGGLFDFLAKRVARAPHLFRAFGMEWLWRLAMEPSRLWKRYIIGNFIFCVLMVTHGFTKIKWLYRLLSAPKTLWKHLIFWSFSLLNSGKLNLRKTQNNQEQPYSPKVTSKDEDLPDHKAFGLNQKFEFNVNEQCSSLLKRSDLKRSFSRLKQTSNFNLRIYSQVTQSIQKRKVRPRDIVGCKKPTWMNKLL